MMNAAETGTRADWRQEYLERYYGGTTKPTERWLRMVLDHTPSGASVLEIGGGPAAWTASAIRDRAREIVGLDIDPVIRTNPVLDAAHVYDGGRFPLPGAHFDVAISRWVNEHLPDPVLHFSEVSRVLKPGGIYLFRTVNLYHFTTWVAYFTPHSLQVPLVRWLRNMSSQEHDPYPTFYRVNTTRRITAIGRTVGLSPVSFAISEEPPYYGMAHKALFFFFMGYERLVNSSSAFEGVRHTLDGVMRKSVAP
jgi:SAM-dependent methyltransferase